MPTATSPYVPVDGDVVVEDGMTEHNIIIQSLHWIDWVDNKPNDKILLMIPSDLSRTYIC